MISVTTGEIKSKNGKVSIGMELDVQDFLNLGKNRSDDLMAFKFRYNDMINRIRKDPKNGGEKLLKFEISQNLFHITNYVASIKRDLGIKFVKQYKRAKGGET